MVFVHRDYAVMPLRPGTLNFAANAGQQVEAKSSRILRRRRLAEDARGKTAISLFQPPRLMAEGANVDPLGSCIIGARAFPDKFRGLVAIGPGAPMAIPLEGRAAEVPKFMVPSAVANVLGRANAIASTIVVTFMTYPVRWVNGNMRSRLDRSIKIFVNAIEAARLFTARRALMLWLQNSSFS
jgi:hypothetical protein